MSNAATRANPPNISRSSASSSANTLSGSAPTIIPTNQSRSDLNSDRRNRRNQNRGVNVNIPNRQPRFEGKCDELKGHVYDCTNIRQADQYARTTKEISEYAGRAFRFGMDTRLSIKKMQVFVIPAPDDSPVESSRTEIRIWEKQIDDYVS